jgi:hypothetical protein
MISRYGNEDEEKSRMQFLAYYFIFFWSISLIGLVTLLYKVIVGDGL